MSADQAKAGVAKARPPLAMALEPRLMFDGAAALTAAATLLQPDAGVDATSDATADATPDLPLEPPSSVAAPLIWRAAQPELTSGRREAVFISEGLPDIDTLAAAAAPGAEVWLVSTRSDGIAQLAAWAAGRSGYDAIHLVGYGAPGAQAVGGTALDTQALTERADELRALGRSLAPTGDILLYGCNITATDTGVTFVRSLSELTGADVAASDDITGSDAARGNWTLESVVGSLESAALQPVGWEASLHTNSVGFNIVNNSGTLTLYFFYGTWHQGGEPAEGALSLYTLRTGGNRDLYSDYTVEAYGVGGALGNQTYAFQSPTTGTTETVGGITLTNENSYTKYTNALIDAAGFVRGSTYYWADTSTLYSDNNVGGGSVYNHQWAQVTGIQPGTYTAYYDTNPVGVTALNGLSATWSPQTAIQQMIFTITASGQVVLGASTPVTKSGSEDAVLSFTDSDFTSNFSGTLGNIKIVSLPSKGTLFVDADADNAFDAGEAATVNQELNATQRGNLRFAPTANINGTTSFQWLAYDQGNSRWATSNSDVSITIAAVNDAPVATGSATLAAVSEDATSPAGATVATLFASNFSDATDAVSGGSSANTLAGAVIVANTANASTEGAWQYTTNSGTTWHDVGTVSSSSGLVLQSTAKLRFVPVADYNGSPAGLTAHLVDSSFSGSYTAGSTRSSVDMAGAGGTSAYSSGTSSLGTSITAVDDSASISLGASPGGSYIENATDKFVAPNLTLSDVDTFVLDSAKLMISTNFSAAQDRLVLTSNAATMGNITGSYNTSTGVMTLSSSGGTATMAQWQEAFRNVRYQNLSEDPSTATRTIDITLGNAIKLNINGVDHYYEYVSGSLTWDAAYSDAASRTLMGMTGYLVTITSAEENAFIKDKLAGNAWMGASDATQSWTVDGNTFSTSEGDWTWVAGPEAGQKFWQDLTTAGSSTETFQGSAVGGLYNNWAPGEPNNWGGTEDVAHFYANNGTWNDFAATNTGSIAGYVVEYSGSGASNSVTSVSTTITPVRANDAPVLGAITQPTAISESRNASAQDINISGSFSVTDADSGDILTPTVVGSPEVRLNGTVITSGFPAALTAAGAFTVTPATRTSTGSAASFTWTYDPAAADLDFLRSGDSLTLRYQVQVGDGVLDSSIQTVTVTINGTDDASTITLGGSAGGSYTENATDKFVDPNLTLSDVDAFTLDSAKVMISNNFLSAQDQLALTLNAATMGNISASYSSGTGVMTLTSSGGTATLAQWQEALRNVRYVNTSDDPSTAARTIEFALGNALVLNIGGVNHYYEYIAGSVDWDTAYTAAANRSFMGLSGYLVTVTSASENAFIKDKLAGNAWMGASDATQSWTVNGTTFSTSEGDWTWVAGPEAGQKFWQDSTTAGTASENFAGSAVGGRYNNWASGEPNNSDGGRGGEDVAHFYANNGTWNDFAATNTGSISGYVVEYNEPSAGSVAFTATTTVTPSRVNDAPVLPAITQPSAVTEAANAAAQDLNITGSFSVTDPDAGDTVTPTVVGAPVVRLNGSVVTTGFPAALTAAGAFTVSPSNRTSTGSAASFTWTYDPAAANLDYLKASDTLTITYQVKAGDGAVDSATRDVTITVQGANDAPVVSDTSDPAAIDELGDAAAQDLAALTGSFALVDLDLGNTLAASVAAPVVSLNGSVITTGFPAALTAAGAFSVTPSSQTSAAGSATAIAWTYDPGSADLDFLLAGDTLTVSYAVTVTDGTTSSTQNVTFTLRGTNEAPAASGTLDAVSVLQGQRLERSFAALFSDEDDATRSYGVQGLPAGLSLDASTGVISGAPTRPGAYTVTLQAFDPSGAVGTTTWQLRVNAPAQAPATPPPEPAAPRGTGPGATTGLTERPGGGGGGGGGAGGAGGSGAPGLRPGTPAPMPGETAVQGFGTSIPLVPGAGPTTGPTPGLPGGTPAVAPTSGPAATPAAAPATGPATAPTGSPAGPAPVLVVPGVGPVSAINPGGGLVIGAFPSDTPRGGGQPVPVVDRVSLVVGASGQVQVAQTQRAEAADASGLIVAEVRRVGGGMEVALADSRAQQVADYSARLPDGQTLPPWVRVDPSNGRISTSPPPNVDALNVRVLARDRDGTTRVMEIRLDFKPTTAPTGGPGAGPAEAPATAPAATPAAPAPVGPTSDAGTAPTEAAAAPIPIPGPAAAPILPGAGLSSMLESGLLPHEHHSRSLRDALATV